MQIQQKTSAEKVIINLDESSLIKVAERFDKLSDDQKEDYKIILNIYQIRKKQIERIVYEMRIMKTTLKTSV